MKSLVLGSSVQNIPILGHEFGTGGRPILFLGAHHGDEVEGVVLAHGLIGEWLRSYNFRLRTVIIPAVNIDGLLSNRRWNSRDVDLNRNLPTKDWTEKVLNPRYPPGPSANSEPETQMLTQLIEDEKPHFIVSFHSYHPMILVNGDCQAEAELLGQHTGYEVKADVGYPVPGSLGTYGSVEKNTPTITYEIERGLSFNKIIQLHVPAMNELMKALEKRYA